MIFCSLNKQLNPSLGEMLWYKRYNKVLGNYGKFIEIWGGNSNRLLYLIHFHLDTVAL